mgnify:CR=1 FL=1
MKIGPSLELSDHGLPTSDPGPGTVPVPGWDGEHEWISWIPFEDLPNAFNPREDYIITANSKYYHFQSF